VTLPEQTCVSCGAAVHRVHRRGLFARLRKAFTGQRVFECAACGWRGWLTPMDLGNYEPVDDPAPPDLTALDTVLEPSSEAARESFSADDLK
jgi:hypothetical protein